MDQGGVLNGHEFYERKHTQKINGIAARAVRTFD